MANTNDDGGDLTRPGRSKAGLEPPGGRRRFKCPKCNYLTYTRSGLQYHIRRHTGEKPFECQVCKSRFKCKSHLNRHLLTHTGAKPYMCPLCPDRFPRKQLLMAHMTEHYRLRQCSWTQVQQAHESVACLNPMARSLHGAHSRPYIGFPGGDNSNGGAISPGAVMPFAGGGGVRPPHWSTPVGSQRATQQQQQAAGHSVYATPPTQWNGTLENGVDTSAAAVASDEPEYITIDHGNGYAPPPAVDSSQAGGGVDGYHLDFANIDTSAAFDALGIAGRDASSEFAYDVGTPDGGDREKSSSPKESVAEVDDDGTQRKPEEEGRRKKEAVTVDLALVKSEPSEDGELEQALAAEAPWPERPRDGDATSPAGSATGAALEVSSSGLGAVSRPSMRASAAADRSVARTDAAGKTPGRPVGRRSLRLKPRPPGDVRVADGNCVAAQPTTIRLLEREVYQCHYCQIFFMDCTMHILHMGLHGRENPWQCAICHRQCRDKFEFTAHSHSP